MIAYFAVVLLPLVCGDAVLQLQMLTYKNDDNRDFGGNYCELWNTNPCDDKFTFCLDSITGPVTGWSSCAYAKYQTGEFANQNDNTFGSDMNGVANPITQSFPRWPGAILFKVHVMDDDSGFTADDEIDGLFKTIALSPAPSAASASWTSALMLGIRTATYKTSLQMQYRLYCTQDYYGQDCGTYCKASDDSVNGHYTCDPSTGQKICRPGWEDVSSLCRVFSDDCVGNGCQNGATCVDGVRSYTCQCRNGFTGRMCEMNIDDCASRPCVNGGTCVDGVAAYSCSCVLGFTGGRCEVNIDDCVTSPCLNSGTCKDGVNLFTCSCSPGFTGTRCELNIDECLSTPCRNNGKCTDGINRYTCTCTLPYLGPNCSDYICNVSNPCKNNGTCYGKGDCLCSKRYTGNDCSINACDVIQCQNGGTCVDGACACPAGFVGNMCDVSVCTYKVCENGGSCRGGVCVCPPGLTGTYCDVNVNECTSNPCSNGAQCVDVTNGYMCACRAGFTGVRCETNLDDCQGQPCQNSGSCTDLVNNYKCTCASGYTGIMCEFNINECLSDPCLNDGSCYDLVNGYKCRCLPDYNGTTCEMVPPPQVKTIASEVRAVAPCNDTIKSGVPYLSLLFIIVAGALLLLVIILAACLCYQCRRRSSLELQLHQHSSTSPVTKTAIVGQLEERPENHYVVDVARAKEYVDEQADDSTPRPDGGEYLNPNIPEYSTPRAALSAHYETLPDSPTPMYENATNAGRQLPERPTSFTAERVYESVELGAQEISE